MRAKTDKFDNTICTKTDKFDNTICYFKVSDHVCTTRQMLKQMMQIFLAMVGGWHRSVATKTFQEGQHLLPESHACAIDAYTCIYIYIYIEGGGGTDLRALGLIGGSHGPHRMGQTSSHTPF